MIRIRIGLLVGGLVALVFGAQNLFTSVTNLSPTQMAYADYCQRRPGGKWLELSDAWVDYRFAVEIQTISKKKYSSGPGEVTKREYYAPIYRSQEDESDVVAFLKCNSEESTRLAQEAANVNIENEEAQARWIADNNTRMNRKGSVKGLVLYGLNESSEDRKLLDQAARGKLVNDFVIIDENEEPKGGMGFLLVLLGVGLVGGAGYTFFKKSRREQPPVPTVSERQDYQPLDQRLAGGPVNPGTTGAGSPLRAGPVKMPQQRPPQTR